MSFFSAPMQSAEFGGMERDFGIGITEITPTTASTTTAVAGKNTAQMRYIFETYFSHYNLVCKCTCGLFFPPQGTVRLVGGQHRCEGRVEMYLRREWGTVCDDAWDIPDAKVVCRQMSCGLPRAAQGQAFFGPGHGPIQLDNLKCTGMEANLLQCSHIAWHVHNCDHSEDASVVCTLL